MSIKLSKSSISSFVGDVLPLQLISDEDISKKNIVWTASSDIVSVRTFSGDGEFDFNDGILLTLLTPGNAVVTAELDGTTYECSINIRKMKSASIDEDFNYYIGDFHDHTTMDHNFKTFAVRTSEKTVDYLKQIKDENLIDFAVISDHSDVINKREFFRNFIDVENMQPMDIVVFAGTESEVTVIEADRCGLNHKNSGEIVTVNADSYSGAVSWDEFYDDLKTSPYGVCVLAHPQVTGGTGNGIWNFSLHKNNTPRLKELVKCVEIGNGGDRGANSIHEYVYSVALDNGFNVSTTCSSDSHGPVWGYNAMPGKTIIMAAEKSKEAFLDAINHRRIYACESGNVKLKCSVNGQPIPCTVSDINKYSFHVETSYFRDDASTTPVKCQVISDYGRTVKVIEDIDFTSFDFDVESDTARYFFLRFTDSEGRRTWSPPVFTGRKCDVYTDPKLIPLDKSNFTALNAKTNEDASSVISDDIFDVWVNDDPHSSIVIDMQEVKSICAVGHYPMRILEHEIRAHLYSEPEKISEFVKECNIYTSIDGMDYKKRADGCFRIYGAEEIVMFPACDARYVKFEVTATVGEAYGPAKYKNTKVSIGKLTVFTK